MIQFAIYISASAILLFGFPAFFLFAYRRYRIRVLRHNLFAARDDLFAAAVRGDLSFDDRAYDMARTVINGLLRQADALSFANFLAFQFLGRKQDHLEGAARFDASFSKARQKLSPLGQAAVNAALTEAHINVLSHLLHISVLFAIPLQLVKAALRIGSALGVVTEVQWTAKHFAQSVQEPLRELDRQAYALGEAEVYEDGPLPRAA